MFIWHIAMSHLMHTGIDYLVNSQNPSSRTFTVTFQSKEANSTENVIVLVDDDIVEGTEAFRLQIVAARFIGQAATIFRAQDGLNNTGNVADVTIEDDDCKFIIIINTPCIVGYYYNYYINIMHALSPPTVVEVSWIISEPIEVREGEREAGRNGELILLELYAQVFGLYASPIEIGVVCAEVIATSVPPGADTISSTDTEHAIVYHTSPICLQPSLTETLLS